MRAIRTLFACVCVILPLLVSCSTGPKPPQPGTPAFYWAAAQETYRAGDFQKTADNLAQLTRTENQFTARARIWELVVASGVAQGYIELADSYEAGARANRKNPMPFRRQVSVSRSAAANAALQFAEAFHGLPAAKDTKIPLQFDYPSGSAVAPPELRKAASGILLPDAELERLQRATLKYGVVRSAMRAAGAQDAARAQDVFKAGEVPRETFLLQMATMLHEQAQLFSPNKLDQPNRLKLLCIEAKEALAAVPPSKPAKELAGKIDKLLNGGKKKTT